MAIRCCHGVTIAMTIIAAIMAGASIGLVWTSGSTGPSGAKITIDFKLFNVCVDGACQSWTDIIPNNGHPWCLASTNDITNADAFKLIRAIEIGAIVAVVMLVAHAIVLASWASGNIRSACAPVTTGILSMLLSGGAAGAWIGFERLCPYTLCELLTGGAALLTGSTKAGCRESEGFGLEVMAALVGILTLCAFCARRPSDALVDQQLLLAATMMELQAHPQQPAPTGMYGAAPLAYGQQQPSGSYMVPINGQQQVFYAAPPSTQLVYAAQPGTLYGPPPPVVTAAAPAPAPVPAPSAEPAPATATDTDMGANPPQ